jgi:lipopolysaccharide/colanic/teichoic acid biosynthesis glycosyltransferase
MSGSSAFANAVTATDRWGRGSQGGAVVHPLAQTGASRARVLRWQRAVNVTVAFVALVLLAPVLLIIAIAVKLTSPGPVLYCQTRVGVDRRRPGGGNYRRQVDYGGRLFTIYKFRTMYVAAPDAAPQVWATQDDPRITPVGRVLRKFRLDELPQFYNVIRGDMNVVGPRPEQPEIFIRLRDEIDRYAERQRVLPGITGLAQVNHTYDQNLDDVRRKLLYDLQYTARSSPAEDLRIMLQTLPVMMFQRGGW